MELKHEHVRAVAMETADALVFAFIFYPNAVKGLSAYIRERQY